MKDLHGHPGEAAPLDPLDPELEKVHGAQRHLVGWAAKAVMFVALAFSTYQLIVAAFHPWSSLVIRSMHVGFLLSLAFLFYPIAASSNRKSVAWYDWIISGIGFAIGLYHLFFEGDIIQRGGDATT